MGITFVGGTGFALEQLVLTKQVALPAGTQGGDFILVSGASDLNTPLGRGQFEVKTEGVALTPVLSMSSHFREGNSPSGVIYHGFVAAGDATLTMTVPTGAHNDYGTAVSITVFRGVDPAQPFDSGWAEHTSRDSTIGMPVPPAQSSTAQGALHFVAGHMDDVPVENPIAPTGFTMGGFGFDTTASTMHAWQIPASPGLITPDRFRNSPSDFVDAWRTAHVTLKPAAGTAPPSEDLTPKGVTVQPELSRPALAAETTLSPVGMVAQPELSRPALTVDASLAPIGMVAQPELSRPALSAETTLAPVGMVAQPELSRPALAAEATLSPVGLSAQPELSRPALSAETTLSPVGLSVQPELSRPAVEVLQSLRPRGLAVQPELSRPALSAETTLSPVGMVAQSEISRPTLAAETLLAPVGLSMQPELSRPPLAAETTLAPVGLSARPELSRPALVTGTTLSPVGLSAQPELSRPTLYASVVLRPRGVVAEPVLSTPHFIVPRGGEADFTLIGRVNDPVVLIGRVSDPVVLQLTEQKLKINITSKYKGEEIIVDMMLEEVTNPEDYTVSVVISEDEGGKALGGVRFDATLEDPATGRFRRVLTPEDLDLVSEEFVHFYNVWSQLVGRAPVWRGGGKLQLQPSIGLPQ